MVDRVITGSGATKPVAIRLLKQADLPVPPSADEGAIFIEDLPITRPVFVDSALNRCPMSAILAFGARSISGSTTDRFLFPGGSDSSTAKTTELSMRIPKVGVLRSLHVRVEDPRGNANDVVYTVFKNGSSTGLTVTMQADASEGADVANTVTVAKGDRISLKVTKALSVGAAPRDVSVTMECT